jgi:DNA-binding MarR family transcriptional regulator
MGMTDEAAELRAMAQTVKRAKSALQDALISSLRVGGSSLRTAHAQVFESVDPAGTRLSLLAERSHMSHQAMSELVAELVELGYFERVADPSDGRAKLIRPTAKGRAELARSGEYLREIRARWQRRLDDGATVEQMLHGLAGLIDVCTELAGDNQRVLSNR